MSITLELYRTTTSGNSKRLFVTLGEYGHFETINEENITGAALPVKLEVTAREFKQIADLMKARQARKAGAQ